MKKIIFFSGENSLKGGGEFALLDIIRKLKTDYEIFCVCNKGGDFARAINSYGIQVLSFDVCWHRKFKYMFSNYSKLFEIFHKIRKISPQLIYANSGHVNPFVVRLAKKIKIPVITHVHDLFDKCYKDKFLFKHCRNIIACSKTVAGLIEDYNKNIKVIYNGIDQDKFRPVLKQLKNSFKKDLNLKDYFLVGNVGAISYKKGYLEFIEVARVLSKIIPKIKFLIIGEPYTATSLALTEIKERIRRYDLENRIIFTGFIKNIEQAIASLDVLLFPPRSEAFGRVIVEAFACKVPVISTYSGGPEEIIEDKKNGFLLSNNDINGMSQAVMNLYVDKKLYIKITKNAYEKFMQRFTVDKMIADIKSTIEAALT